MLGSGLGKIFMSWQEKKFINPNVKIRLATVFSGIGAIEHAFQRLNLDTDIIFAGDIDKFVKQSYMANYKVLEEDRHDDITTFVAGKSRVSLSELGYWIYTLPLFLVI
ncbi:DNA cytosine methyltransferase [Francisella noatunensis subsp. orientalis]|uniref:DNA cytosine methyltransferase n=1 Tax=Francisella orientalis TaxID=299583 RepID=A0AAW9YMQ3_9GAMM|nr:C-5 cytosine-specific DNA methylase [Francisella orientalis FNO12]MBK2005322.1 DNA cytosine methyltransferase [Francisella orientalis]MBK2007133.1 DNA cytosine methyltransferase [Francisella orientalis]MBK2008374.1 DNA cytosine methyltransferase [Francisella orientalis]MBK2009936.1 DNA cytosine methyltransferase [Francisella orientalis]